MFNCSHTWASAAFHKPFTEISGSISISWRVQEQMELAQGTWGTQAPCPVCLFQSPCKQLYRAASSKTLLIISFPNRKGYIWESEFDWVLNIEDNWPECRRNPSVWRQRSWSRDEQNSSAEQTPFASYLNYRNMLKHRFCSQLRLAKTEIVIFTVTSTWKDVTCKHISRGSPILANLWSWVTAVLDMIHVCFVHFLLQQKQRYRISAQKCVQAQRVNYCNYQFNRLRMLIYYKVVC